MSNYQTKENSGAIFKNDRKEKETQPDYTGTINVAGKDWQISLWVKETKEGKKYFSASIKEPFKKNDVTKSNFKPKDDFLFP